MYIYLNFLLIILLGNIAAVELSTCIKFGGCGLFSLTGGVGMGTVSFVLT